ncbi:mycocerosic acid synthase-like [Amphiura filiformis]|uniref:mycocerosic acid synthase-like n=1 Tax=Amphiura filiformis TaxID=82378 RepID=UPI003B2172F3
MDTSEQNLSPQKIAIVGIGCRFAEGVDTVEKLWEVLAEGRDCSSTHPEKRYDVSYFLSPGEKLPGKMYNRRGCYLTQDPYTFDRSFFKMSPDEAQHLDPTIRILLEVTWEALEDAGIAASAVRGSHTGVYVGGMNLSEYRSLLIYPTHNIGQYTNSGNTSCMMANRVSYEFDFRGPSIALDTACSSSMSAIFLACEALKSNQCPMAVAGGVNIMLMPEAMVGLCQAGMVSPDGRSKSFDKTADGYGRGEGFGIIVLKTLEKALKDKDRIYAVIRGGALSNDGRTTGISSPSADAQRDLLKAACLNAKVAPGDVTYAEAHGTGTSVGDKAEATVLGEVFGQCRSPAQPPLHVGSIKSNLGHTEGAAGVAGIIKTALCLKHKVIPKVVHFNAPNPELDFNKLNLYIPQNETPWPSGEPLIASCSSFGFGGANACMIVEAATSSSTGRSSGISSETSTPVPLLISAATEQALAQRLRDWLTFLQRTEIRSSDRRFRAALYTAAHRSNHHQYRIAFVVRTAEEAINLLRLKVDGGDGALNILKANCVEDVARPLSNAGNIAFVFSGMGTQWWGMARELMHKEPIFATMIKRIEKHLKSFGSKWSLVDMLSHEEDTEKINETEIAQPCICAVQIALAELWRSRRVIPAVIVGHSVGEVAAVYCAGLLSLKHAIGLIYHRGRQLRKTSGSGTMMAVLHQTEKVREVMRSKGYDQSLDVAAINSPNQVVVSGDSNSINDLMSELNTANIRCVQLKVRNAFHSRQQNCLEFKFKAKVSHLLKSKHRADTEVRKTVPIISTVTGRYMTREEANSPEYWWKNIRQTVLFKAAVENLVNDGFQVFVEIGSHPAVTPAVKDTINTDRASSSTKPVICGSLKRPQDTSKLAEDRTSLLLNHTRLHVSGVKVNFRSYFKGDCTTVISIPKYPWQRELCTAILPGTKEYYQFPANHHPLLGEPQAMLTTVMSSTSIDSWKSKLSKSSVPWLKDHVIGGSIILPAACYVEVSLAVARQRSNTGSPITLRNVQLHKFMYVPESDGVLETTAKETTPSRTHVTVSSCDLEQTKRIRHMETDIVQQQVNTQGGFLDVESIATRCNISISLQTTASFREAAGLTFGPSFETTTHGFVNDDFSEILTYCEAPEVIYREFHRYIFHPAFLDGCLQSFAHLTAFKQQKEAEINGTLLNPVKQVPSALTAFTLYKNAPKKIIVHLVSFPNDGANTKNSKEDAPYCNITIADADTKEVVARVEQLKFQKFEADTEIEPLVWSTNWATVPVTNQVEKKRKCLIIPDKSNIGDAVQELLEASGVSTVVAKLDSHGGRIIQHYFENDEPSVPNGDPESFTDILVLQALDMSVIQHRLYSTNQMTLTNFRLIQEQFPLFCISLILEVIDKILNIWPRLIFITSGANAVFSGENVNPFMSEIQSLIMTTMHEEPRLHAVSIDLPVDVDPTEAGIIIHKAYLNLPKDENILACRTNGQAATSSEISLLAPRLRSDSLSNFRIKTCDNMWVIHQNETKAKISIHHTAKSTRPSTSNGHLVVNLQAVCIIPIDDSLYTEDQGSNAVQSDILIYAGLKQSNSSGHNSSLKAILGIRNCATTLSSITTIDGDDNFIVIPDGINCPQSINIVKDYLPAQIFFHDIIPITANTKILFLADNTTSDATLSFALFAHAKGAQLTVISVEEEGTLKFVNGNGIYNTISIDDVSSIGELSIDLLIVPMTSSALQKHVPIILGKLNEVRTVLYLFDADIKPSTVIFGRPGTKSMSFSTSLTRCLYGKSPKTLLAAAKDILEILVGKRTSSYNLHTWSSTSELSTVHLVNGTFPKLSTITISEDQTELPVELYDDLWHADKDESYLVTGGASGFGLSVVTWLVSRGAKYIFVLSRHTPDKEVQKYFAEEEKAQIKHIIADVSNASDIDRVFGTIQNFASPPIVGIFHLATVYRDGYLSQTTKERWHEVMEAKAYGALLLHQVTQKLNISLKYFVVSSSIVSMIGNVGQGNYCAANTFLNSLCQMRHHMKLPAAAVCIGYINRVGYAATNNLVKMGEESGIMSITPEDVLRGINIALSTGMPLMGFSGPFILRRFIKKRKAFMAAHSRVSVLKELLADMEDLVDQSSVSFSQLLMDKSEGETKTLIVEKLCKVLSTLLGLSGIVDTSISLLSLGLDSLMATNVSEAIFDNFEVLITPVALINESMTVTTLQDEIFTQLSAGREIVDENIESSPKSKNQMKSTKPWVESLISDASPRLKMVCFPSTCQTGGGASIFTTFSTHVIEFGIQLLLVQYPGAEGREGEPPSKSVLEIVDNVTEALIDQLDDGKFVFFGHSVGSLIALETARKLRNLNLRPMHIFVSAFYAPTIPYPGNLKDINSETFARLRKALEIGQDFFQYTSKSNGISLPFLDDTVLSNRVLLLRMLPAIEATVNIIQGYKCESRDPLQCGLTVFSGKHDPFAIPCLLGEWKNQIVTGYRFKKVMLEGKQLTILSHVHIVLKEIRLVLKQPAVK